MIKISIHEIGGKKEICAQTDDICLRIRPWQGAKIYSLISKRTGFEFFFRDPRKEYEELGSKAEYIKHDITGYDECFPTIAPCLYPYDPWKGLQLGDHGWLWNREWEFEITNDRITTWIDGEFVSFRLSRTLTFEGKNTLVFYYLLHSQAKVDFRYIWSAHPVLTLTPSSQLLLPEDNLETIVYFDLKVQEINGTNFIWPNLQRKGIIRDLSRNLTTKPHDMIKLFFPSLPKGECSLVHHSIGERIRYEFDLGDIPYLGLWVNEGYPFRGFEPKESFCIAFEPCTGLSDALDKAKNLGRVGLLPANGKVDWQLRLSIE